MTLLIACLLIYGLDLSAWLYPVAVVLWWAHLAYHAGDANERQRVAPWWPGKA